MLRHTEPDAILKGTECILEAIPDAKLDQHLADILFQIGVIRPCQNLSCYLSSVGQEFTISPAFYGSP
jgi:hypothetical protein